MRFILAFSCFFRLLFGLKLNPKAVAYLPEGALAALPAGPAEEDEGDEDEDEDDEDEGEEDQDERERERESNKIAPVRAAVERKGSDLAANHREGALAILGLLQREGRLVDFLLESIDDYEDSDVGAAVRDIHRGCRKVLGEHLKLEAVMPGQEDEEVDVPRGFDPGEIRLVGDVSGDPPFHGVLRHHGWRVIDVSLPTLSDGIDRRILAPAEVEVER